MNPGPTHPRCLGGAMEGSRVDPWFSAVVEKRILGARQGMSRDHSALLQF